MDNRNKIYIRNLSFSYNGSFILKNTSQVFQKNRITAIVGPSGSGKSTFLRILNRLWETLHGCEMQGRVEIRFRDGLQDIYDQNCSVTRLRRQVGMVFQAPNPLPMSIFKNLALPLELEGERDKKTIQAMVEKSLKLVGLRDEVSHRLHSSALELSGGQQQRLCIARAMILEPEILLLDEPTSSLDHRAAAAIENLLIKLKDHCTILLVSHYPAQVQRVADIIMELKDGMLVARK